MSPFFCLVIDAFGRPLADVIVTCDSPNQRRLQSITGPDGFAGVWYFVDDPRVPQYIEADRYHKFLLSFNSTSWPAIRAEVCLTKVRNCCFILRFESTISYQIEYLPLDFNLQQN